MHRCVADADRLALTDHPATRERYVDYLVRLYGFQAPLESAFSLVSGLPPDVAVREREWTRTLVSDLQALGYSLERVLYTPLHKRRPFRSAAEALGWLYVAEVTRNGHQLLRHFLARKVPDVLLGASPEIGRVSHDQWQALSSALDDVASSDEAQGELHDAALDAYDAQHRWFRPDAPSGSAIKSGLEGARLAIGRSGAG
ncbi:MAG: hypothetical protein JO257_33905 [Deltaproteobacteria bacterium]|nr:hypothetical protein [Deltaproteobacteria bacterium]